MSEPSSTAPPDDLVGFDLDTFDDLFFTLDEQGRFLRWNQAVVDVTGYDDEELASMGPGDFLEREDAEQVAEAFATVFETGRARVDATVVTNDGERIPHEFRVIRFATAPDEPRTCCGIGRDITARRAAGRERRALLDRMTDAFFAVDPEWRLTYVNDRAAEVLSSAMADDVDTGAVEGNHLWEAIPEAVDTVFYDRYHEAMRTQEPVSFREHYAPLDTWFDVRAYPSETGLSVFFRDVTEQQRRREELQSHERVLRELHDVTADTERSFDEQVGALMDVGREVLGTGYATLSRVEGERYVFEAVRSPDDAVAAGETVPLSATNCERAVTTERTLVLEDVAADAPALAERAGNVELGISCYLGAPVFVDANVYGTFCFYDEEPRDEPFSDWEVTLVDLMAQWVGYELERQRTNERLARKNERLEEFASIVSHDLRNPLNVLQGSLDFAEETGDPERFAACRRAADRMERLIEDVLTLAREGETVVETTPVDLASVVEQCWTGLTTDEAHLQIETDRTLVADESRLKQVLENLIRNAVEHGPSDVTITVGALEDGFYVADDGPGVPEDERDRVFDSGYSTSTEGTGFGLAIVERITGAHGWTIELAESADGGARFEIRDAELQ